MNLPPELIQFAGSLVAILALAALAYAMRLGGTPILASEDAARRAAHEAVDGFAATEVGLDAAGQGALLRDDDGRILLLKPHGNKFAGRILSARSSAKADRGQLVIESGERRYGSANLVIDNAQAWAEAINALRRDRHA